MNDDIDDRAIDAFNMACGTTRKPEVFTPDAPLPFHYRRELSSNVMANAPILSAGANAQQGLTIGFRASRSIGDARQAIASVEDAHGEVTDRDITIAARKAGLTPLRDPSGQWAEADSRRLRGN